MRALIQRVSEARVLVEGRVTGEIGSGLLLFVGVGRDDTDDDADWLARKIAALRIFADEKGKMSRSAAEAGGRFLSVSQFTLYGDLSRGNRPGFDAAGAPEAAKRLWEEFNRRLASLGADVQTGVFAAHMDVQLSNDGPVTFWLDSADRPGRPSV